MHQPDTQDTVAVMPALPAPGTPGWYTAGDPGTGVPASVIDPHLHNAMIQELLNVLVAGGVTPDKATLDQVATAIQNMIANASIPVAGYNLPLSTTSGGGAAGVNYDVAGYGTLVAGRYYPFRPHASNSGAITVNGLPVLLTDGRQVVAGQVRYSHTYRLQYNTTFWLLDNPASLARRGASVVLSQSCAASAWTRKDITSTSYDTDGIVQGNALVVPAGATEIELSAQTVCGTTDIAYTLGTLIARNQSGNNGSSSTYSPIAYMLASVPNTSIGTHRLMTSGRIPIGVDVNAGDSFYMKCWHNHTGALTLTTDLMMRVYFDGYL